jgi:hypothetical protein
MTSLREAQKKARSQKQLWFIETAPGGTPVATGAVPDAVDETGVKFGPITRRLCDVYLTRAQARAHIEA